MALRGQQRSAKKKNKKYTYNLFKSIYSYFKATQNQILTSKLDFLKPVQIHLKPVRVQVKPLLDSNLACFSVCIFLSLLGPVLMSLKPGTRVANPYPESPAERGRQFSSQWIDMGPDVTGTELDFMEEVRDGCSVWIPVVDKLTKREKEKLHSDMARL